MNDNHPKPSLQDTGDGHTALKLDSKPQNTNGSIAADKPTVYRRRLWTLALFSAASLLNAVTACLYTSVADVTRFYYDVSEDAVNWTVMTFMVVYLVLLLPVTKLFPYVGLRWIVILGSLSNTTACAVLFAGLKPDAFPFVMVSVVFAACSNALLLGVPPFLAAAWFPAEEVSRASACGVIGNQFGLAIGYVLPPYFIENEVDNKDLIEIGKRKLAYIYTAVNLAVFILIIFTFQSSPPSPPSASVCRDQSPHSTSVLQMLKNKHFILVLVVYGLSVAHFFAFGTTLNDLINQFYENKSVEIGWMGFLFIVAGLAGSIIAGYILDITHKFKETALTILIMSLICHILFAGVLYSYIMWVQFIVTALYGFFLSSFLSVGFEYGVEVTYPDSEYVCASLMNASMNIIGTLLTPALSHLLDDVGPLASNSALAVSLITCCVVTSFITTDYRRTKKNAENEHVESFKTNTSACM